MLQKISINPQYIDAKTIGRPPAALCDEDIITQIKSGDINAYGSIMRRYNQRIFRVARSFVSDDAAAMDVIQEAHIKAFTKLDSFNGRSSFLTWLAGITRNEALMYLRKHKKEVVMDEDDLHYFNHAETDTNLHDNQERPDAVLENKQLQGFINDNLDQLPEDFRTVFVLRAIECFSVRETAIILNIKEETVKTRYFRAKRLLRGKIQRYLETSQMHIYEFGGHHCDIIVANVLQYLFQRKAR